MLGMRSLVPCLVIVLALTVTSAWGQETAPLIFVGQPRVDARLVDIRDRQLRFELSGETKEFTFDEVIGWGWPRSNARAPQMVSPHGDVLIGEVQALRPDQLELSTELFGTLRLQRSFLAGIVFHPPNEAVEQDRLLQRIIESKREEDSVTLMNGDELEGIALIEPGSTPNLPATTLHVGPMKTATDIQHVVAVIGVLKQHAPREDQVCWIGLRDGTRLAVRSVSHSGSQIVIELHDSVSMMADTGDFLKQVIWVAPAAKRFVYLSAQQTAGYKHVPFLTTDWQLGLDRNVLGGNLRCSGHEYSWGLGMHSASRAAYDLDRRYRWFESDIALDDVAGKRGAVIFRVFVDRATAADQGTWKLAYESSVIRGGDAPIPIRVDVAGADRIALVVDFAERGDECDYANWLLARLIPR